MDSESNAPDWSKEIPSDQLLANSLQERLKKVRNEREHNKIRILLKYLKHLGFTPKERKEQ